MKRSMARKLLGFGMVAALTSATSFPAAGAMVEGRTGQDRRYIAGGIGLDESSLNKGPYIVDAMRTLDDILKRMQAHQSKKRPLMRALRAWNPPDVRNRPGAKLAWNGTS